MARRITLARLAESLDQLAAMTARGFEDVRREFEDVRREMHEGFAAIHATLTDHTQRLDRVERKLDNTIHRVDDHDVRLQVLEKRRGTRS